MPIDQRLLIPKKPSAGTAPPPGPAGTGLSTQGGDFITDQNGAYIITQ